ncbi:cytidylate kinase-like family protein [Clostridium vitabionis]|uniref:cytidylate kinase-like family protein n=1 Tax=Clostridium vitabionis TaxID=2784388 RepID=UPI00188D0612|nr:cytidylate kinase-like family protein [Clostridium vitabionis]
MAGKHMVITIGRQYGSGGAETGRILAELLGICCYDKNILKINSDASGIRESYFHLADEKAGNRLLYRIMKNLTPEEGAPSFGPDLMSADNLFRFQSEVIRKLAAEESCVFIGRCADYVLDHYDVLLRVHVIGSWAERVSRIREKTAGSEADAEKAIRRMDRERGEYYRYYTGRDWADAQNYDLVISTDRIGPAGAARVILEYLRSLGFDLDKEFPSNKIEQCR